MKDKGTQSWATAEYMCRNLGQSKRLQPKKVYDHISHPYLDHNGHLTPVHGDRSNSHIQNLAKSTWGDSSSAVTRLWLGAERVHTSNSDFFQVKTSL